MNSQEKRIKINELIFQWDHKAPAPFFMRNKQLSIDKYFDLLAEIKPHKQELKDTKIFGISFTLP
jgi:hypothetical protein